MAEEEFVDRSVAYFEVAANKTQNIIAALRYGFSLDQTKHREDCDLFDAYIKQGLPPLVNKRHILVTLGASMPEFASIKQSRMAFLLWRLSVVGPRTGNFGSC